MAFYGLLVGLGVAELLLGLMKPEAAEAGLHTPLLGLLMFLQLMALFIDSWMNLREVQKRYGNFADDFLIWLLG